MRSKKTLPRPAGVLMSSPATGRYESVYEVQEQNATARPARPLQVCFVPHNVDNPYQRLLGDALAGENVIVPAAEDVDVLEKDRGSGMLAPGAIIHLHWLPAQGYRSLPKALRMLARLVELRRGGYKLVWTVHNLTPHDTAHPWLNELFSIAVARVVHALIVHAPSLGNVIERELLVSAGRIHSIPHGNYISEYPNVVSVRRARAAIGVPKGAVCFAFVGYMKPYKGIGELLRAFSAVKETDARLLLAGPAASARYGESIEAAAKADRRVVVDRRYIPREELQLVMNAASVLVFPFRQVFTSGSIVLAMSFGKPCIAADGPFTRESLGAQGNFLYDASSPHALADMLRTVVRREPEALERIGQRNYALAKQWSWEYVAHRTRAVYESVVG